MTIIVAIMFRTSEWFEDKWYLASTYQRAVSLGIGIPLWIAMFSFIAGEFGNVIGFIMFLVMFVVIVLHVRRWKTRKGIDSEYERKESYDDRTYRSQSNSRSDYSDSYERTYYKESSGNEETYDREEESRRYSKEEDYQSQYEDREQREEKEEPRSSPTDITLKKCYEILDVAENASADEIKKAYKKLVKQWHPDSHKSKERKEIAESEMKKINEAYEMLEKAGKVK